ncbi:MAG: hypothetical protein KAX49_07005 [Halanaerobiales bacterium]|nr:hypothetical protein [Halanaerobiales bacterium]
MNIKELYNIIVAGWNEEEQTFVIKANEFSGTPINKIISEHFPEGKVTLKNSAKPILENTTVQIKGLITTFLNISDVSVVAKFWIDELQIPQCQINFSISKSDYKLSDSFTVLQDSPVDSFIYEEVIFTLETIPSKLEDENKELQKKYSNFFYKPEYESQVITGLRFQGMIKLPEMLEWIKLFINEDRFTIKGAIDLLEGVPRFSLNSESFEAIQLGHLQLPFKLQILSLFKIFEDEENIEVQPETLYRFISTLQYTYEEVKISIPLHSDFYSINPYNVILETDTRGVSSLH